MYTMLCMLSWLLSNNITSVIYKDLSLFKVFMELSITMKVQVKTKGIQDFLRKTSFESFDIWGQKIPFYEKAHKLFQ